MAHGPLGGLVMAGPPHACLNHPHEWMILCLFSLFSWPLQHWLLWLIIWFTQAWILVQCLPLWLIHVSLHGCWLIHWLILHVAK